MDYKVVLLIIMKVIEKVVGGHDVDYSYSDAEGDDTSDDLSAWQVILIVLGCIVIVLLGFCCKLFMVKEREERAIKMEKEREERARKILSKVVFEAVSKSYNQGVTDGQRTRSTPHSSRSPTHSSHQDPLNPKPRGNTSRNKTAQDHPQIMDLFNFRPAAH